MLLEAFGTLPALTFGNLEHCLLPAVATGPTWPCFSAAPARSRPSARGRTTKQSSHPCACAPSSPHPTSHAGTARCCTRPTMRPWQMVHSRRRQHPRRQWKLRGRCAWRRVGTGGGSCCRWSWSGRMQRWAMLLRWVACQAACLGFQVTAVVVGLHAGSRGNLSMSSNTLIRACNFLGSSSMHAVIHRIVVVQ